VQLSNNYRRIYSVISNIPRGKVATYGQIASKAGLGKNARLVGYALSALPEHLDIPWHRVINSRGEISYSDSRSGHDHLQLKLLETEGIKFDDKGKVDMDRFNWNE
jgi:methylated-DNA-protein-cysteine methyltransferase-like protein